MAHERKCIVCGSEYKYCPKCSQYNADEKWRFVYCSDDCRMVDAICSWYKAGRITEAEAREKLNDYTVPAEVSGNLKTTLLAINKIEDKPMVENKFSKKNKKNNSIVIEDEIVKEEIKEEVPTLEEPKVEEVHDDVLNDEIAE